MVRVLGDVDGLGEVPRVQEAERLGALVSEQTAEEKRENVRRALRRAQAGIDDAIDGLRGSEPVSLDQPDRDLDGLIRWALKSGAEVNDLIDRVSPEVYARAQQQALVVVR
jgi:hypothetical protein